MTAASAQEEPEVAAVEALVGGDRRVLVVPIGGIEEIELEVLVRGLADAFAIDDDAGSGSKQSPAPELRSRGRCDQAIPMTVPHHPCLELTRFRGHCHPSG